MSMSFKKQKTMEFDKRTLNTFQEQQESKQDDVTVVGQIVTSNLFPLPFWHKLHQIESQMSVELSTIIFPKDIAAIYNPLDYAESLHCEFMDKYLDGPKKILFVGMNPGPYGMVQTAVPFGHVPTVVDWLKLTKEVKKPAYELSSRPVEGLKCSKVEQSGLRWWGLIKDISITPENFFKNCFIYNYCPLAFFASSGRNITPAEIKGNSKAKLQEVCNKYLHQAIILLHPEIIVSIGRYAEDRVKYLQKEKLIDSNIQHKCIPHPSPRSLNNTDWPTKARIWFEDNQLLSYLKGN